MLVQTFEAGPVTFRAMFAIASADDGQAYVVQAGKPVDLKQGFLWQRMVETDSDHGHSTAYGVLLGEEFGAVGRRSEANLEADLADCFGLEEWVLLRERAKDAAGLAAQDERWPVLLMALWAERFAPPLSPVWLAAMAHHAFYVAGNLFAFGILTGALDQRLRSEEHFERGARMLACASQGGRSRAEAGAVRREGIIREIARFMAAGHSVTRAAALAHRAGFGCSPEANRRLWTRHRAAMH